MNVSRTIKTLIPNARETLLAADTSLALAKLAQSSGDLVLTVTGEAEASQKLRIPASALRFLAAALAEIASGNGVSLLPVNAELTTQQAAAILNVSRPHLVGLLEKGEIAFRKVGVQRRVRLQDVTAYRSRTNHVRRTALDTLARQSQELNLGYDE